MATPLRVRVQAVDGAYDLIEAPTGVQAGDTLIAIVSSRGALAEIDIEGGGAWVAEDERATGSINTRVFTQVAGSLNPTTYAIRQDDASGTRGTATLIHLRGTTPAGLLLVSDGGGEGLGNPTPKVPDASPGSAGGIEVRYVVGTDLTPLTWTPGGSYPTSGQGQTGTMAAWAGAKVMLSSSGLPDLTVTPSTGGVLFWQAWTLVVAAGDFVPPPPPTPAFTPGKGSSLWRYTAHDFLTGQYRDDLYPQDPSLDKRIGEPGSFTGTLPIPNARVAAAVRRVIPRFKSDLTTGPGRIEIRIWRDGVLQPRYWLTGARLAFGRDGKVSVQLRASTLDAYFYSVRVRTDLSYSGDQVANVRSLLQHAQTQPGANIGLLFQSGSSGVSRPLAVKANDGTTYGRAAEEYARTSGGFEYVVNEEIGPTGVESTWEWGYPKLGSGTEHVFTSSPHGGEIAEMSLDIDALRGGTDIQARGGTPEGDATADRSPVYSAMVTTPHRAAGWPRIDRLTDHPNQSVDSGTLTAFAQRVAATSGGALWVRTVTVFLGKHSTLTMQNLGDYARLVMTDVWHQRVDGGAGLDISERVIGMQIRPAVKGRGKDEATLVLASPEVVT
ncbi:hypothetical protein [Nonomuraea dietziae]|uniref:hypothetical protein n=1 Tax=Nonomuraea dietziae TaxID=65515 RepID=UPI0033ED5A38